MKKIFTEAKLRESMLHFINSFKVIESYTDTGYLPTKIGIRTGYNNYIYTGVYDESSSSRFKDITLGTLSSGKYDKVEPSIFTDTIKSLINSKTCKWSDEEKEKFNAVNSCRLLLLPFNFKTKRNDSSQLKDRELQIGVDSVIITKLEANYNPITKMCPLKYTCFSKSERIRLNLIDYPSKTSIISFSDGNYVKSIIINDKKAKQKLVVDCTGIYLLGKTEEIQLVSNTKQPIDTTDWVASGVSKKIVAEIERNKQLIFVFWRWLVPYQCGEAKEIDV